jgi:hypothetical protein
MNQHIAAMNRLPEAKTVLIEQLKSLRKPASKGSYLRNVSLNIDFYAKRQAIKNALLAIKVSADYNEFFQLLALYSFECQEENNLIFGDPLLNTSNEMMSLTYLKLYRKVYNRLHHAI